MQIEKFAELQQEMEKFQEKLHRVLEERKLEVLSVVDGYQQDVQRLEARQQDSKTRISELKVVEKSLEEEIESSKRRKDETTAKAELYTRKRFQMESEREALTRDLHELRKLLRQKQDEIQNKKRALQKQRQKDFEDVKLYENVLGLSIDATAPESLRFAFNNVSDSDPNLTCEITLDLSQNSYKISDSQPELTRDVCLAIEDKLNQDGDLAWFLKESRVSLISESNNRP